MSRSLKPMHVEDLFDQKTRNRVELMLDRNDKVFFAVVEHERISAPSIEALRTKVKEALSKLTQVEWSRVIELSVSGQDGGGYGSSDRIENHSAEINVTFKRFEVGTTTRGINLKRPFLEDEHEHWREDLVSDPLMHTSEDYDRKNKQRLPYSDAVWAALQGVKAAVEAAYAKLEPLFDSKDRGQKLLAMTGLLLLPATTEVVDAQPVKKGARR